MFNKSNVLGVHDPMLENNCFRHNEISEKLPATMDSKKSFYINRSLFLLYLTLKC